MRINTNLLIKKFVCLGVAAWMVFFVSDVALAAPKFETIALANQSQSQALSLNELLSLTNKMRSQNGLLPLVMSEQLNQAALNKAYDMQSQGYWDHFRPSDKKAPWDFIEESGYNYKVAGENLARGFRTAGGITDGWMKSPTHKANLLSEKYLEVGFASIRVDDGKGSHVLYTVQMFGTR